MSRTELDGDVFVFTVWLVLGVACSCECEVKKKKKWGASVCGGGCFFVFVFLSCFCSNQPRAFFSSQINLLLKRLFLYPGAERQHNPYQHCNFCSTSFDASSYCNNNDCNLHWWFHSHFHTNADWIKLPRHLLKSIFLFCQCDACCIECFK